MKVKGLNWAGRSFILPLVIVLFVLASVVKNSIADTSVSGSISSDTTWTKATSPYIVTGSVVVNSGTTLTIESGVTVKLNSGKAFQIDGTLIAKGTNSEKITFTRNSGDNWGYILFSNSSTDASYDNSGNYTSGSILEYCVVEYAGGVSVINNGAIRMDNAHPFINYCTIQNNSVSGIYAYNLTGTLKITNSTISNNSASSPGGGIYCSGGTKIISNNTISNNTASFKSYYGGGGIYCSGGTNTISNNTISNNTLSTQGGPAGGGGIYCGGTNTISNNTISNNTASSFGSFSSDGGGIFCSGTNIISNNTISNNSTSFGSGGGIFCYSGGPNTISNNTISNNAASSSGGGIYNNGSTVTISNNHIVRNSAANAAAIWSKSSSGKYFQYNTITGNKATGSTTYTVYITSLPILNYNNVFSNTATYELWNDNAQSSSNLNAKNNWWGSADDSVIQGKIYDFVADSTKAIVDYSPYATSIHTDCPISPPTGLTATKGEGQITLSWSGNSESDLSGYKVYWDTDSGYPYANSADVGNTTSYTITGLATGKYYVTVTAYDSSYSSVNENASTIVNDNMTSGYESWYAEEKTVTVSDSTVISKPTVSTGSATNITSSSATLNGTVTANGASTTAWFQYGKVSGTYDSTSTTTSVSGSTETPVSIGISGLSSSATYYYRIAAQNSGGTSYGSETSFTTSVYKDTTAPSGSISINSGASYTNSTSVTLALSATDDSGVTGYYISTSSSKPSASASGWTTVSSTTNYSESISYTLNSGDGNKTVYVWYKDAAGNVSSSANDAITLDTTAPTITITSPTSDATYTTTSSTISLSGSASDSTSGVSSVTWSSGTASGTTSWSISNITLSSGDNVITVTATDNAGNTKTDTIKVSYTSVPSGDLVAYYPFNGNADDKSGNGNHGTVYGASLATDKSGSANSAYNFDGVNDYIEVSDSSSLDITSAITIVSWVYINKFDTNMQVVQKDSNIDVHAYALPILSDYGQSYSGCCNPRRFGLELLLNGKFKSGMWSNEQLNEKTWYFLAATYNGSEVKLYLNGQNDSVFSVSGTIETNNNPVRIGNFRGQNNCFLNGQIDDVRIYNRALSESEILGLYNEDGPTDTTPPTITITSPTTDDTYTTTSSTISLIGNASDDTSGVSSVTWSNDKGGSGTANGTTSWSISNINLSSGDNVITVTATDGAGNTKTDTIKVSYTSTPSGDLVAYYPFNGNADDESGNGNDGTVYGASLTTDRCGNANSTYSFDGVNDYIEVSDSSSLDITSAISIAAWVYINKFDTNMQVVQKDSNIDHHAYALPILSDYGQSYSGCCNPRRFGLELLLDGRFKSGMWSNTQLNENTQYFLTATYDGSNVKLYLNGQYDTAFSVSGTIETNNNPVRIGNFKGQNRDFLNGIIDDIRIYNRALSASDILDLYNEKCPTDTTPPTITITSPTTDDTYTTTSSTISLGGSASDATSGVSSVAWSSNKGESGTASGTTSWSISNISLTSGDNVITVTATDGAGNTGTDTITVTYESASDEGSIYGFVKDEDDEPIENVSVCLTGPNGYFECIETDEDGFYIFEGLAAGDYSSLEASKTGYQTIRIEEDLTLGDGEELEVDTIYLEPPQCGSIYGYVVNIRGDPVENARLKLRGLRKVRDIKCRAVSDKDGFFEFSEDNCKCLEEGKYVITVNKKRYRPAQKTEEIEDGEQKEIEIVLRKKSHKMKMLLEEEAE